MGVQEDEEEEDDIKAYEQGGDEVANEVYSVWMTLQSLPGHG